MARWGSFQLAGTGRGPRLPVLSPHSTVYPHPRRGSGVLSHPRAGSERPDLFLGREGRGWGPREHQRSGRSGAGGEGTRPGPDR